MFELPDAKRVRREELFRSDNEGDQDLSTAIAVDDTTRAKLNERLSSLLSLNMNQPGPGEHTPMTKAEAEQKDEEEFVFRLFSTSTVQAVVLAKEEDDTPLGGGEIPFKRRPLSYYIRPELTPKQKAQFDIAAVSGQDVLKNATQRAWGFEVPWRVTQISLVSSKATSKTGETVTVTKGEEEAKKRKRPGKKKRIVLRKAEKKRKEEEEKQRAKKEAKKNLSAEKEEALKAKKSRLNRERKLKRRQKAREQKTAMLAAGGGGGEKEESGSGSGSDSE